MESYKIFHWANFRNGPKKSTNAMKDQALKAINVLFIKFFSTYSWCLYSIALSFLILGLVYLYIDERRQRNLLERRRQIRRSRERPPQKRRPGAQARNHEIYRTVMRKVNEYMEPANQTCVIRKTRSGTIYGQVGKMPEFNPRDEIAESIILENE